MSEERIEIVCPHCGAINRVPGGADLAAGKCGKCHQRLLVGGPVAATEESFDRFVTRNAMPVVVDFWAAWCGPCRAMAPVYERVAAKMEKEFRFLKVDTEAEPGLASRYQIRSIPTLMILHKGRVVAQRAGASDGHALEAWLQQYGITA
ncbi:thioredoxin TrxC [Kaistia geumhonensis]|uniref:Thioredoxin n=1 Tax=Kaistia geumhonensis TaxID=410839 RepID=A0ABU0MAV7_9HYPH|nr:thioredoxin TrxC [Kaistia geumhonensis]MCX5481050.1 thioredoxin TrxC [Kaistia geumhonensis]MDQ0518110.1 thioredoxin 2 [Kaistia geumhonensis]